ncbi:MAG: hypothetical protein K0R08_1859 [Solimicrobium sp.]|jgi:hypothetical protein|nr:hypothetical protein [Solimicrobium sp.]
MESINTFFETRWQTFSLDANDVNGLVLNRGDVEKVIHNKGNLSGAYLKADIDVKGLKFESIKMDKHMLQLLIHKGADVTGVDLSYQNCNGIDLTNVDLSHSICKNTKFENAIFNNTNLAGVDLSTAFLSYAKVKSVIFTEEDRNPYIELYKNRLFYVLKGKDYFNNGDPFYRLDNSIIKNIRDGILCALPKEYLDSGMVGHICGAQSICVYTGFDMRLVAASHNSPLQRQAAENAIQKLLGNGFSEDQKILFHQARAAMWQLLKFTLSMFHEEILNEAKFWNGTVLEKIYIINSKADEGPSITPLLAEACFAGVLWHSIQEYKLDLTEDQMMAVRELFLSPDYFW